jgi:hypothetical protein
VVVGGGVGGVLGGWVGHEPGHPTASNVPTQARPAGPVHSVTALLLCCGWSCGICSGEVAGRVPAGLGR